ncbi:MAG: DUF4147 domain-containing protein [Tepidisphaera sp.]|nr:DUF4147 domain-containing protein [Tepidisphaera sp.]
MVRGEDEVAKLFEEVRRAVLEAADPRQAVSRAWRPVVTPSHLLCVGKAALAMGRGAMDGLNADGSPPKRTLVLCPHAMTGAPEVLELKGDGGDGFELFGCDHPLPTARNVEAAKRVAAWVAQIPATETLVSCVSGGGSAYLTLPVEGVPLEELVALTKALQASGADIRELNAVRKHVEQLKGGRLGQGCACSARVYVLSDVIGDRLDVIASGPFAPDQSTYREALETLTRYGLRDVSASITRHLEAGARGDVPETPKHAREVGAGRIEHEVVAGNDAAVDAACAALESAGVKVVQTRRRVEGAAAEVGISLAHDMSRDGAGEGDRAWVVGGEWVVEARGAGGKGGPSQELALAWAAHSAGFDGCHAMAFSTDGVDGPTDAAGAEVSSRTQMELAQAGCHAEEALRDHDSHAALGRVGGLVKTGPTGTNVNHIVVGVKLSGHSGLLGGGRAQE